MKANLKLAKEALFCCDFSTAFEMFEDLAARGNAEAQCFLGEFYDDFGFEFPVDFKKARELYEQSWAQGFARAGTQLYTIYSQGHGVARDKKKALKYLNEALKKGDSFAKTMKAILIVDKDEEKSVKLLREASKDPEFVKMAGHVWVYLLDRMEALKELAAARKKGVKPKKSIEDIEIEFSEKLDKEIEGPLFPSKGMAIGLAATIFDQEGDGEFAERLYREALPYGNSFVFADYAYFLWMNDRPDAFDLARKSVEMAQDFRGMLTLGCCYFDGCGVERDYKKAREWFEFVIERADGDEDREVLADTYFWLGVIVGRDNENEKAAEFYEKSAKFGKSGAYGALSDLYYAQKDPKAFKWAKKGKEEGDMRSAEILTLCYANGIGVKQNFVRAVELARELIKVENAFGANFFAEMLVDGVGVPKNISEGIQLFKSAYEFGDKAAAGRIAYYLYGENSPEAYIWAKKGAEADIREAEWILCLCYRCGLGTKMDLKKHIEYAKKLLESGDPNGAELLAIAYEEGLGVPVDSEKAIEYYLKAEELGMDVAVEIAARLINAVAEDADYADPENAFHWATIAYERDKDDPKSNCWIGFCYLTALGTKYNFKKAVKHLEIAASAGYEPAKEFLEEARKLEAKSNGNEDDDDDDEK